MTTGRFLVRWTYGTNMPGLHGWHSRTDEFASVEAARDAFNSRPPVQRLRRVELFDATGTLWRRLDVRSSDANSPLPKGPALRAVDGEAPIKCSACGAHVGDPHIRDCPNLVNGPTFWPSTERSEVQS